MLCWAPRRKHPLQVVQRKKPSEGLSKGSAPGTPKSKCMIVNLFDHVPSRPASSKGRTTPRTSLLADSGSLQVPKLVQNFDDISYNLAGRPFSARTRLQTVSASQVVGMKIYYYPFVLSILEVPSCIQSFDRYIPISWSTISEQIC